MSEQNSDYRQMWADLGLDLDKHDALLGVLGQMYEETYLSQENRPAAMGYFDFVMSEVHGLRIKELVDARAAGRPVVGAFCVYVPEELVLAVDGICVGLCAGADFGTEAAERYLPRTTCALIKSFFGFHVERVCPYTASCDLVVGENTCDGKKKAYESFAGMVKRFFQMDLPQTKNPLGRSVLAAEYRRFAAELEQLSGRTVTAESLRRGIRIVNAKREAIARLQRLRAADPAPISGRDALLIEQISFYDDPERFTASVNQLCDELEQRIADGEGVAPAGAPRILVSGCPMAVPNWKLPPIIEGAGALVVGEESCVGMRGLRNLTADDAADVDGLVEALVDRYFRIDCATFTPNPERVDHVREMSSELAADGVIHYALQFCAPYQIEAMRVEHEVEDGGLPLLRLDTDYGPEDSEQLRTRVEAFVERIRG